MPPFDAAAFDLDGTLIDTEALCNEAGVEACAKLGLPVSPAFFATLAGIDDVTRARLIGEHARAAVDLPAFLAEWDRLCHMRFARGVPVKRGAPDLLRRLEAAGVPLALVTSSRASEAAVKLRATGLDRFFPVVVTFDDVAAPKPAPDPYLLAARRLGADPRCVVAFEDSEPGAASARAAGMVVVQVPDLHGTDGAHAHHVARDLLEGAAMAGLLEAA